MTLKELYIEIGGDYDRALSVLRIEKLIDKHIRKLPREPHFRRASVGGRKDGLNFPF